LRHVLTRRRRPRGRPRVGLRRSDAGASDQRRTPCTMGSVADPVGSTGAAPARPPTQPTPSPPESIPPPPSSLRDPALTCLAGCARSVAAGPSSGAGGRGRPTEGRRCGAESAHGPGPLGPARPLDLGAPHPVSRIRLRPARPSPASRLAEDPSLPLSLPLLYQRPPPGFGSSLRTRAPRRWPLQCPPRRRRRSRRHRKGPGPHTEENKKLDCPMRD
jgi:hypothetical protein